jgi:hypothetical protein
MNTENSDAVRIEQVISDELQEIRTRRGKPAAPSSGNWKTDCHQHELFGISVSGGGIRSATFGLGVLQGLTEKGLLQLADYISTVSGGGYLGAWLQGVLSRGPASYDSLTNPRPRAAVKDPITFLRKYSNYLAPRTGLSLDALMIPLIWFRNMVLNQAMIIAAFAALLVVAPWFGDLLQIATRYGITMATAAFAVSLLCAIIAIWHMGYNLRQTVRREDDKTAPAAYGLGKGTENVMTRIALPMFLAVVLLVCTLAAMVGHAAWTPWPWLSNLLPDCIVHLGPGLAFRLVLGFLVLTALHGLLQRSGGFVKCFYRRHGAPANTQPTTTLRVVARLHILWMSVLSAAFTLLMIYVVSWATKSWAPASEEGSQYILAFLPSLYFLTLISGVALQVGLMGQDYPDSGREWLVRLAGLLLSICAGWTAVFTVAVLAPIWMVGLALKAKYYFASLSAGWIITTITSVLAGNSGKTAAPGSNPPKTSATLDIIARFGPWIAIGGFLIAVATGVQLALHAILKAKSDRLFAHFTGNYWWVMNHAFGWQFVLCLAAIFVFVILSLRVNINEFSMHHFYRNRLVRCYLGASAGASREPDAFTGFDPSDDLHMHDLAKANLDPRCPHIPYPIVNTALTVTSGSELATQERKALPWFFTPLYSGFAPSRADKQALLNARDDEALEELAAKATFVKSKDFMGNGVLLGTATATSGAAVNPNMGYHSSPQTAFLLTLFNVRLGWWVGNPQDSRTWRNPGPKFALRWLISELFGFAKEDTAYLNLSDGGHFENLGLYELVRRRCHFIIAIDGEADGDYKFESLGGAVRKCRTDFGVEIDIDPRPIQPKDNGRNGSHCVIGRIYYPEKQYPPKPRNPELIEEDTEDTKQDFGWLLYIKSSITGDEPADVEEYRREHPEFPQQSTADQFFSESQFESYRRLGLHAARTTLDHHDASLPLTKAFSRLARQWELSPPLPPGVSTHHAEAFSKMMDTLANSKDLKSLDPSVILKYRLPDDDRMAFFFRINMLQLMENVFLDLNFANFHNWNHPSNEGWHNVFVHWANDKGIREIWRNQKFSYAQPFRIFLDDLIRPFLGPNENHRK